MDIEVKVKVLVAQLCQLFVTPWTVAHQASLSMGFPRKEYGLPFPSPGDLPDSGIEPGSPALRGDSLLPKSPGKPHRKKMNTVIIIVMMIIIGLYIDLTVCQAWFQVL